MKSSAKKPATAKTKTDTVALLIATKKGGFILVPTTSAASGTSKARSFWATSYITCRSTRGRGE